MEVLLRIVSISMRESTTTESVWLTELDPSASCIGSPTTDLVQDHPAAWDWRVLLAFAGASLVALYYL